MNRYFWPQRRLHDCAARRQNGAAQSLDCDHCFACIAVTTISTYYLLVSCPSRSEFKAYRVSTARTLVVPAMALKTFATLLLLSGLAGAAAGPMVCATCYNACIAGCWANGVAATAATLGVAAPAGLWGAAACSSMCAPTCACLCPTPTP